MARIPITQILSLTEYTGNYRPTRLSNIVGMVGQAASSSPLDKIEESTRIRIQQLAKKGSRDEIGLYDLDFDKTFRQVLKVLSISWVSLYAYWKYCDSRECAIDSRINSMEVTEGCEQQSDVATGSQGSNNYYYPVRKFTAPTILGWFSIWRPTAHIGPSFHNLLIKKGDVDILLRNLENPLQPTSERNHHLQTLECISRRHNAVAELLKRKSVEYENLHTSFDYSQYANPQSMADLTANLFPSHDFSEIPEGVSSPLCLAFWPALKWIAVPSEVKWNDIFKRIGYVPSEELGRREFGSYHLSVEILMRVVSDIICACPAKDREVPLAFLKAFVSSNDDYWLQGRKREEYRAHLLRLLLENEQNCLKVFDSEAMLFASHPTLMNNSPKSRSKDLQRPRLVLEYLYNPINEIIAPIKEKNKFNLSKTIETQDIHFNTLHQINECVARRSLLHNMPGAWLLTLPHTPPERSTLTLNTMIRNNDYINILSFGILTSLCPPLMMAGGPVSLSLMSLITLRALFGLTVVETVYAMEERLIQSQIYSESYNFMLGASLLMIPINSLSLAFVLSKAKWGLVPFVINRCVRETLDDSFRRF